MYFSHYNCHGPFHCAPSCARDLIIAHLGCALTLLLRSRLCKCTLFTRFEKNPHANREQPGDSVGNLGATYCSREPL